MRSAFLFIEIVFGKSSGKQVYGAGVEYKTPADAVRIGQKPV